MAQVVTQKVPLADLKLPQTKTTVRSRAGKALAAYPFLLPVAAVFVVLYAIPIAKSAWWSFTDANGYTTTAHWVGLRNYEKVFTDPNISGSLTFTLGYTLATTLIVTVLAIPLAVILNRRFPGRNAVRSAFYFTSVPSGAIVGLVWGFILSPLADGVLNSILSHVLGVGPVSWLGEPLLAQISVVMVAVWAWTGWHALIYLAYLQTIPQEYYEAARADGAGRFRIFFSITLPLLAPAMTVSQLFLVTNGLKVYDLPFTLTKGGPAFATRTITQGLIETGIARADLGEGSALAVVFLLLVGVFVATQLFLARKLEKRFR